MVVITTMKSKTTKGRQKIEIKELEKESNRQVTFSKRRAGMFKKASELCLLSGAEIAIIVFSKAGKAFCFGHPDVDTVLTRYLTGISLPQRAMISLPVDEFNRQHAEAVKVLEKEKKRLEEIEKEKNSGNNVRFLWEEPIEEMGLEELENYLAAVVEMRGKVATKVDHEMMVRVGNTLLQPSYNDNYGVDYDHVGLGLGNTLSGNSNIVCGSSSIGSSDGSGTCGFGFGGQLGFHDGAGTSGFEFAGQGFSDGVGPSGFGFGGQGFYN